MKQKIVEVLKQLGIPFEEDVDLKRKTWIHRGGTAHLFIIPQNADDLKEIVGFLYKEQISFFLFGHTSNLYIKNNCDIDVVVSTMKCNAVELTQSHIFCESGVSVINLSHRMIEEGIAGFEYLTELPGTVGAALVNNSSCNGNSISKLLERAEVLYPDGSVKTLTSDDFHFQYRNSDFKTGTQIGTILTLTLRRINGNTDFLREVARKNSIDREKRVGGHAKNLGCTVNKIKGSGEMSLKYSVLMRLIRIWGRLVKKDAKQTNRAINHVLCKMAHCQQIEPYISPYNPIVFVWEDEGADAAFPLYLEFMRKVYKFNSLEIQVVE